MGEPHVSISKQQVVDLVRIYLQRHQNNGLVIEVMEPSVRHSENWWYVPVRPNTELRTYQYYDLLSEVETDLVDRGVLGAESGWYDRRAGVR